MSAPRVVRECVTAIARGDVKALAAAAESAQIPLDAAQSIVRQAWRWDVANGKVGAPSSYSRSGTTGSRHVGRALVAALSQSWWYASKSNASLHRSSASTSSSSKSPPSPPPSASCSPRCSARACSYIFCIHATFFCFLWRASSSLRFSFEWCHTTGRAAVAVATGSMSRHAFATTGRQPLFSTRRYQPECPCGGFWRPGLAWL